jgi:hypothetical protein
VELKVVLSVDTSKPEGGVTKMPAVILAPETENWVVVEAVPYVVDNPESVPLVLMVGGGVTLNVQSVVAAGGVASQLDAVLPMAESKVAAVPEYVAVVSMYLAAAPLAGEMKVEPAVNPLGRALVLLPMSAPKIKAVGVVSVIAPAV